MTLFVILKHLEKPVFMCAPLPISTGSPRRELALTKARANAIADYFWEQGIDARFIFAQGLSRYKPIAHNLRSEDRPPNSRIEIVFYRTIL